MYGLKMKSNIVITDRMCTSSMLTCSKDILLPQLLLTLVFDDQLNSKKGQ
jgi:hypothetical protein